MNKVFGSAAEALDGILRDGMLIAAGGFGLSLASERLALRSQSIVMVGVAVAVASMLAGVFTAPTLHPPTLVGTFADGKQTLKADDIVIATGSIPIEIPGFKVDQKRIVDSTGALELDYVPKRMLCIGGGMGITTIIERV